MSKRILRLLLISIIGIMTAFAVFALSGCDFITGKVYCTVTFDSGNGTDVPSQRIEKGTAAAEPPEPEKEQFIFVGWFTADDEQYDFSKAVTQSFTLYAKWEPASQGDPDDGNDTDPDDDDNTDPDNPDVTDPDEDDKTDPDNPDNPDVTDPDEDDKTDPDIPDVTDPDDGDKTDPDNPDVTDPDEDDKTDPDNPDNPDVTDPDEDDKTDPDIPENPDVTDPDEDDKTDPEPVDVYFTVTFDSDGGSVVPEQYIKENYMAAEPENPEKQGYILGGWYTADGQRYNFETAVTKDITLYAHWAEDTTPVYYTVSFNTNCDATVTAQYVLKGEKAARPKAPENEGYLLEGWYTDETRTVEYDFGKAVTADLQLYANWIVDTTVVYYTVTFEADGGNNVPAQLIKKGDTAVQPKAPEKTDYVFDGWYTEEELVNEYNFEIPVTSDVTLYAKWAQPYKWVSYQADFTDSSISSYSSSGNKIPSGTTVGRFTFGSVYVEGTGSGMKLEKGNMNTQATTNSVQFELNGINNKISFRARTTTSGTSTVVHLYKAGENGEADKLITTWDVNAENDFGIENLEAGTYYIGIASNNIAARIGALVISEYVDVE